MESLTWGTLKTISALEFKWRWVKFRNVLFATMRFKPSLDRMYEEALAHQAFLSYLSELPEPYRSKYLKS
jgi:hypothetical protein